MTSTWKGIKNKITLNLSSDVPRTVSVNDVTISDPCDFGAAIQVLPSDLAN